jgi:hypothetical protein
MIGRAAAFAVAVLLSVAATAPVTIAVLTSSATGVASLQTATLAPATSVSGANGTSATLTWTPSVSSTATGYNLLRSATSGSGYAAIGTVTPVSAATTTDTPHVGTWYYVLQTYVQGWTSASSNQATVVVSAGNTGLKGYTANAPETTGSGDNNGYELNPGNACALDGAVATDANSGTSTTNTCTGTGKDRHQFWGYAFGLSPTPTSIDGITLKAVAGENNTTGTTNLCVQLSWDGGTTWTTARTIALTSTALATYTLGTATDNWGHSPWTASQLGATTFKVRITDNATITTKTFTLDYLGVQVAYTP